MNKLAMISPLPAQRLIAYTRPDVLLVFRRDVIARPHHHHALQLTIGLDSPIQVEAEGTSGISSGVLIEQDRRHQVVGQGSWVATLLMNPHTTMAQGLSAEVLRGAPSVALAPALTQRLTALLVPLQTGERRCEAVAAVIGQLWEHLLGDTLPVVPLDPRIVTAIEVIEAEHATPLRLTSLADTVALSVGRFAHLFRAEVGLPFRRYLRWQRLLGALGEIAAGTTFTEAAHAAGFSDSAHLSRTFRETFGLSLSTLLTPRAASWIQQCSSQRTLHDLLTEGI